jgi:hypothetical protein
MLLPNSGHTPCGTSADSQLLWLPCEDISNTQVTRDAFHFAIGTPAYTPAQPLFHCCHITQHFTSFFEKHPMPKTLFTSHASEFCPQAPARLHKLCFKAAFQTSNWSDKGTTHHWVQIK